VIQLLLAAGVGAVVAWVTTRILIGLLTRRGVAQPINEDIPVGHAGKAGTPTFGGVAIVAGVGFGYLAANLTPKGIFTWTGMMCVAAIAGAGLVGFIDDFVKVRDARNKGLTKKTKSIGLVLVGVGFATSMLWRSDVYTTISFARFDDLGWELGRGVWVLWAVLVISAAANAVNLTDGLDGLAAGAGAIVFGAYVFVGYWIFRHFGDYLINVGLDLAIVAAAMMSACAAFLWWNAPPARIFMGDTGSLAIGTGLAVLALSSSTVMLLPIIGGLFVIETLSVIGLVTSFRLFKKRPFHAPIHHDLEERESQQRGIDSERVEPTVTIRLWILTAACAVVGLGLFFREYVRNGGLG
jgi:phospho-N-acetylmuramoyl-pentapeptide-transferase